MLRQWQFWGEESHQLSKINDAMDFFPFINEHIKQNGIITNLYIIYHYKCKCIDQHTLGHGSVPHIKAFSLENSQDFVI